VLTNQSVIIALVCGTITDDAVEVGLMTGSTTTITSACTRLRVTVGERDEIGVPLNGDSLKVVA
jgi:hypothetical protein